MLRFQFFLFILLLCGYVSGQSLVYGLYTDDNSPYDDFTILATVEATSGVVIEKDTIFGYEAVVLGSSSFDQLSANYIYLAAGDSGIDLLSRNVYQNTTTSITETNMNANALQFDMSTGLTYGLGSYVLDSVLVDPDWGWYEYTYGTTFISLDIATGNSEVISELPSVNAVVLGASCFDPMNGIYYFIGISQDYQTRLFGVNSTSGNLELAIALDLGPNEYINELEYDIDGGTFYALHRNNSGTMHFAQIDPFDGSIFDLLDISTNVNYFTPDASVYHQDTDQFIMLTVSPNTLLTIDADDGSIVSQASIDYNIIELEVDNVDFATAQFVSVAEIEKDIMSIGPNPADDQLRIYTNDIGIRGYRIFDITGTEVRSGELSRTDVIDVSNLGVGVYLVELEGPRFRRTEKFVISR